MDYVEIGAYLLSTVAIIASGYYAFKHKEKLDHMCSMMVGMIYSTLAGFAVGTLYAFFTGEYLMANILGIASGLAAGLILHKLAGIGDEFARMEAVMGAAMGGLMGAMLGFMIRFENPAFFLVFYSILVLGLAWEGAMFIKKHVEKKEVACH